MTVGSARPLVQIVGRTPILEDLATHRVFGTLSRAALIALAAKAVERTYLEGHHLFYAGDSASDVFVVKSGFVVLTETDRHGNEHVTLSFYPGDVMGLGTTLLGLRWAGTATAMVDTTVLIIPKDTYDRLYRETPRLAREATRELLRILNRSKQSTARLTLARIDSRLAAFLLESAHRAGRQGEGQPDRVFVPAHQQLALILGTRRETITRIFGRLTRGGIVATKGHAVFLLRIDALRQLAEG